MIIALRQYTLHLGGSGHGVGIRGIVRRFQDRKSGRRHGGDGSHSVFVLQPRFPSCGLVHRGSTGCPCGKVLVTTCTVHGGDLVLLIAWAILLLVIALLLLVYFFVRGVARLEE